MTWPRKPRQIFDIEPLSCDGGVLFTMTLHHFHDEVWVPKPRAEVFPFFAEARNLNALTPPWLRFEILTEGPIAMGAGTLIDYRLRLYGFPIHWQTEITGWEPEWRFVDEQRRGPYRLWRHTHTFAERAGGTVCTDDVEYAVPGGALVDRLFVRRDVRRIFAYRREVLLRTFGGAAADGARRGSADATDPSSPRQP